MVAPTGRLAHLNEPAGWMHRPIACSSPGTFVDAAWGEAQERAAALPLCRRCVERWSWWLRTVPFDYEAMLRGLVVEHGLIAASIPRLAVVGPEGALATPTVRR